MKTKRILLVDDSVTDRTILRDHLVKALGCTVVEAIHGEHALETMEKERIDAVVTDMLMPVMDGLDLARVLRRDRGSKVPIVIVTCLKAEVARSAAVFCGANAYISKPLVEDSLVRLVGLLEGFLAAGGPAEPPTRQRP